jgi:predicted O-methyltransferase YrrM
MALYLAHGHEVESCMLMRVADWFDHFGISAEDTARAKALAEAAVGPSAAMMNLLDFHALAAALLHRRPARIFEIGTYLGVSSNFFLSLLPDANVVSIAFISREVARGKRAYNNTELGADRVGSLVAEANRPRFTQIIGDSHAIIPEEFLASHGPMDFVFIDGDHSRTGVGQDTTLAHALLAPGGAIGWHDANPRKHYLGSRQFLEEDMALHALATADTYIGGVAFWTPEIEVELAPVKSATEA